MLRRLEEVRGMVRDGLGRRVVEAAVRVRELKTALMVGEEEEEGDGVVVFGLLRKEWGLFVEHLERIVRFEVEHERIRVCSAGSGVDGVELCAVVEAMDVLDILDYGLARTADSIIKHVIGPAMNLKAPASFIVEANENSGENCHAVLRILPYLGPEIYGLDGEALFSRMIILVNFIFKHICLENGQWMRLFGKLAWPRMSDLIISNFLNKVVPDDASKLSDFRSIVSMSSEFEKTPKDIMFISAADKNDERLSNFADNVETHFALRKKIEILAKARKLIPQCDFTLPQKRVVSEAACQLMRLVHHTHQVRCLENISITEEMMLNINDENSMWVIITSGDLHFGPLDQRIPSLRKIRKFSHTGYPSEVHHGSLGKWRTINLWIYGNGGDRFHESHIYRFTITKRLHIQNTKHCALGVAG
ncbi:Centromere/kinetochore protein zw10-like protein [Drosera capensis]